MSIIDVRDWEKEEYGFGTRKKYLYIDPLTRRSAFFKYPMVDEKTGQELIGEIWSEKIAADIGKVIKIPTPEVVIAQNEEGYGSLSFNFLEPGEQLHHGAEFLDVYFSFYESEKFDPRNLKHHKLDAIFEITKHLKVMNQFINIIIFDSLIGNSDRHSENWGLVSNANNGTFKLAPAYDNSSSLAREFNDDVRFTLLKDENRFQSYVLGNKSAACISTNGKKRTQHFDLVNILLKKNKKHLLKTLKNLRNLYDGQIDKILSSIPDNIMSSISKKLVNKILIARRDKLLEIRRENL
ncbi:HipA domain-containing protein [Desulfolucanica intricata]|uniref:HipA domain-containing protein n=1 Tax=Desulfolucanica intricata TaxID=1285191 RepID=UPI00082C7AC3|nr:HipA domain-containing protein [Desulfolucanica intricata]